MNNNQCHREVLPEKLTVAQLSIQSLSFTEHISPLLFSPTPDSHPLT